MAIFSNSPNRRLAFEKDYFRIDTGPSKSENEKRKISTTYRRERGVNGSLQGIRNGPRNHMSIVVNSQIAQIPHLASGDEQAETESAVS